MGMMRGALKMSIKWEKRITVIKGDTGEKIVTEYLVRRGYIPYKPEPVGAHPFDRLCATPDKKHIFIAEIKTKPARVHYPDTGIDIRHYRDYENVSKAHNLEVFIFFVDQDSKQIYGNKLSELVLERTVEHKGKQIKYPLQDRGIIYFPLVAMKRIGELSDQQCETLESLSTRNAAYFEARLHHN